VLTCAICFDVKQLLLCTGKRNANGTDPGESGHAVGAPLPPGHAVCEPCIIEWFRSRNEFRAASGLRTVAPPSCPVCKAYLQEASPVPGGVSADHCLGLPKVKGTW